MRHVVVFSKGQIRNLLSGKLKFDIRFFKKRPLFLKSLSVGDIIFFRKDRGEIAGQFEVGKLIVIQGIGKSDWEVVKRFVSEDLSKEKFEELEDMNNTILIIQIKNLEQLITSPIELPKGSRREWIIVSEEIISGG